MTEAEAISVIDRTVPRETMDKLHRLAGMILEENAHQNLIAKSTEKTIWNRHMLDSAQLWRLDNVDKRCWLDVGTGAGFPGLVLAILSQSTHVLVEPRRRRAEFLDGVLSELDLKDRVCVERLAVEKLEHPPVGAITARAVSTVDKLLSATHHLADQATTWMLHKGRHAAIEIAEANAAWDARFETSASVTDPDAVIVRISQLQGRRR